MKRIVFCFTALALCLALLIGASPTAGHKAIALVDGDMFVYQQYNHANNHYLARSKIGPNAQEDIALEMDEANTSQAFSGTGIECRADMAGDSWGGYIFTYGKLSSNGLQFEQSFGEQPDSGLDLTGAKRLEFMAKGLRGGEKVEFFMGGLGWDMDANIAVADYPDSAARVSLGTVTLSELYQAYALSLEGVDLSYIGCGFGFIVSGQDNSSDIAFYLDDIKYAFEAAPAAQPNLGLWGALLAAGVTVLGGIYAASISRRAKKTQEAIKNATRSPGRK